MRSPTQTSRVFSKPSHFHHGQPLPANQHLHLLVPTQPEGIPGENKNQGHHNLLESEVSVREGSCRIFTSHCTAFRRNRTLQDRSLSLFQPVEGKFLPVAQPNPPQHW